MANDLHRGQATGVPNAGLPGPVTRRYLWPGAGQNGGNGTILACQPHIASDDGVIQSTYLGQVFRERKPTTRQEVREATVSASLRRVRPCLMTSATTILALIPILTSVGRGSEVMVPMAIPSFGGMLVVLISILVVPVLYSSLKEWQLRLAEPSEGKGTQ